MADENNEEQEEQQGGNGTGDGGESGGTGTGEDVSIEALLEEMVTMGQASIEEPAADEEGAVDPRDQRMYELERNQAKLEVENRIHREVAATKEEFPEISDGQARALVSAVAKRDIPGARTLMKKALQVEIEKESRDEEENQGKTKDLHLEGGQSTANEKKEPMTVQQGIDNAINAIKGA